MAQIATRTAPHGLGLATATLIWAGSCAALAQPAPPIGSATGAPSAAAATAASTGVTIELNKLEAFEKGCRAYLVVNNASATGFQTFKLDLVTFQPDGVIGRRFAIDLAPIKANKKTVKLFDIEGTTCERVASVLVNDVMDCKADTGPLADCLNKVAFSSVAAVPLTTK